MRRTHDVDAQALLACASEPIHQLGRVQSAGMLLAFDHRGRIAHVSANAAAWTGRPAQALLGAPAETVLPRRSIDAAVAHGRVAARYGSARHLYGVAWPGRAAPVDVSIHDSGGLVVIEAEPVGAGSVMKGVASLDRCAEVLTQCNDTTELAAAAARAIAELTGYDRVMVYRFAADGSGTVVAETARPSLTSYLGLRYPASDIPAQARALYLRNPSRTIANVADDGVPVLGLGAAPLDLSLATLRSVSPVHLEYLRHMGTAASMSVSLGVNGRLWGLLVCHHRRPKRPALACRAVAEAIGRLFGLAIGRVESEELQRDIDTLLLRVPGVEPLMDDGAPAAERDAALAGAARMLRATGASLHLADAEERAWGDVPDAATTRDLLARLADTPVPEVVAVDSLAARWPAMAALSPQVAGLLALPLGMPPREWLLFYRDEVRGHVVWAGRPEKNVDPATGRLSPRNSFAAWRESVVLHAEPWTPLQIELAEALRVRLQGLQIAHRERRDLRTLRSEAHRQGLLVRELNHRIRNMLTLVKGLVHQGAAGTTTVEDLARTLQARVDAMARAHMQIARTHWGPAPLIGLLENEIRPFSEPGQATLAGPPIQLEPDAYMSLALVFHELATNARKYGALSRPAGRLAVHWAIDEHGLRIDWRESGGPPLVAPTRRGFGTQLIAEALGHELQGRTQVRFLRSGLCARLEIPKGFERDGEHVAFSDAPASALAGTLPRSVLLVEDDLVVSLMVEAMLTQLGCSDVARVSRAADALSLLADRPFDLALLDADLGDHDSTPVAERLRALGIPAVVSSGHDQPEALPPALRTLPAVCKPYGSAELLRALTLAMHRG